MYRPWRTIRAADLDQLLAQGPQRSLCDRVGQGQAAQEVGQVVGEREELETHGVIAEGAAGQPGPSERVLPKQMDALQADGWCDWWVPGGRYNMALRLKGGAQGKVSGDVMQDVAEWMCQEPTASW